MVNIDKLAISSPDIHNLERIPNEYSAAGGSKVPQLEVRGVPNGAISLSIVLHDPDAPMPFGFTHWVGHGLPAVDGNVDLAQLAVAENTMGEAGYVGPFPPAGHGRHHYYFWVYALDTEVEGLPNREEFLSKYAGNIVEQARFVATYSL